MGREREMNTMMMGIFGALLPRFVLLVGWYNDPTAWTSLFGSGVWFLFGFLFFPWTTLIYGFVVQNGMSLINWIFVGAALLIDLGTWGIGAFATREQVSNYRGT
jgi:hypothetical protein